MSDDINIQRDRAHDDKPQHVDVTVRLPEIGGALKTEINPQGEIYRQEILQGDKKKEI
jgi:hypothetical protein